MYGEIKYVTSGLRDFLSCLAEPQAEFLSELVSPGDFNLSSFSITCRIIFFNVLFYMETTGSSTSSVDFARILFQGRSS